jgi:prevent-host-death family protein
VYNVDVVLPLRDVRQRLSELVDEVERTHQRVTITRNGRPVAAILSIEDLESIQETLAVLRDPGALQEIEEGLASAERGEGVALETVTAEFEARTGRKIRRGA